ncbi:hypothetical protein DWY45_14015 [Phocaeicola plebeius]|nr:hypothetical protein DWY45_14015 [Phocaeicola plebeius]HAN12981.1 hypothetical protein [Bacteroides sp.]
MSSSFCGNLKGGVEKPKSSFLRFPFLNRMFSVAKTYVSQQETVRFPAGKHRNPFCFIHYSQGRFTMKEDE